MKEVSPAGDTHGDIDSLDCRLNCFPSLLSHIFLLSLGLSGQGDEPEEQAHPFLHILLNSASKQVHFPANRRLMSLTVTAYIFILHNSEPEET